MHVFVMGGTGLIGRRILERLLERGDRATVLTRRPLEQVDGGQPPNGKTPTLVQGDPNQPGDWMDRVSGSDAVVNLVGENLFARRWDDRIKRAIRESRVDPTRHLVEALRCAESRPSVLVQASAVGYYGNCDDTVLSDAEDHRPGDDYLAEVCAAWEAEALAAEALGVRVVRIRIGVVLARGAGALGVMEPIFKWLPGGAAPIGSGGTLFPARGEQWFPWIHLEDIAGLFLFGLDEPRATGVLNGTAPEPVNNREFSKQLARAVGRPFLPIGPPDAVLRVILGQVAEAVTHGQCALPVRVQELGYAFHYPRLEGALQALYPRGRQEADPSSRRAS